MISKNYKDGDLSGTLYKFESLEDKLPLHSHSSFDNHVTFVLKGKVKIISGKWERECLPGDLISFEEDSPHEILNLEEDSLILNLLKKKGA